MDDIFFSCVSFWFTYFVCGYFLDDDKNSISFRNLSKYDLYKTLIINMCLTFLLIPITNKIPTVIIVSDGFVGYIFRVGLAILMGDVWLYITHRLLHYPFYRFHKQHHIYTNPHALAGLYAHPIEYIFSNHLSMIVPLKLISRHELMMVETAFVAFDILRSHAGRDDNHPSAKYHTLHHERMNCNYSFAYVSDKLFGTYVAE